MMEFYAQELWIFLIYNVRGSLLSCLPLRLVAPRPHAHSLCSLSLPRSAYAAHPATVTTPGSPLLAAARPWGCVDRNAWSRMFVSRVAPSGQGLPPRAPRVSWFLCLPLPWALHTGPAPLSRPPAPRSAVTEARSSYLFWGGLREWAGAREHLPEKYISYFWF